MGGKQKQAQRTKGNARPSSSSRSAEKLGAAHLNGFTGFGNIQLQSDHLTLLKSTNLASEVDPFIDGDCRMLMKRMTKKDAVTRQKALQEFQQLCLTCTEESLLGALPLWPRLFNKLCLDVDRKVREVTHNANKQLALRMKRNMAPHIKSMMGNWLLGMCDPYAPSATAAKLAFDTAFAKEKQREAILYCKENIFATITDCIFHQTPQTLADSEAVPVEVMEEMYTRLLSSSLLSLPYILQLTTTMAACRNPLMDNFEKLMKEEKFWKFPKSEVAQVRHAWFRAIAMMCALIPEALATHLPKVCPAVLGHLHESDPLVVYSVWDAVLHMLNSYTDCWKHVDHNKSILPKLFAVLRKGCHGNAKAIGPYLLPVLSRLPNDIFCDKYCADFFNNFRQGIELDKVQSSASEYGALVAAYMECLQYTVIDIAVRLEMGVKFSEGLIDAHLLPLLQTTIKKESPRLSQTPLYSKLGEFLSYLHCPNAEASPESRAHRQCVEKYFWCVFSRLSADSVESVCCMKDSNFTLVNMRSMFEALPREGAVPHKKPEPKEVRFICDQVTGEESGSDNHDPLCDSYSEKEMLPSVSDTSKSNSVFLAHTDVNLSHCVFKLCCIALRKYRNKESSAHLRFLTEMNAMFACRELCDALNEATGSITFDGDTTKDAIVQLYECFILTILAESQNSVEILLLIRLAFDILRLIDDQIVRFRAMNQLCLMDDISILSIAAQEIIKDGGCQDAVAKLWLKGPDFSEAMLKYAERLRHLGNVDESPTWDFLELCLVPPSGNPVISPESIVKLLDAMRDLLPVSLTSDVRAKSVRVGTMHRLYKLARMFFATSQCCWSFPESGQLLLSILKQGWLMSVEPPEILDDMTLPLLETCWRVGTSSLIIAQDGIVTFANCLHELCKFVHDRLLQDEEPMKDVIATTEFMCRFLEHVGPLTKAPALMELLSAVLPTNKEWAVMYSSLCHDGLAAHAIGGKLLFNESVESWPNVPFNSMRALAFSMLAVDLLTSIVESDHYRTVDIGHFLLPYQLGMLNTVSYCLLMEKERKQNVAGCSWSHWGNVLWEKLTDLLRPGRCQLLVDECFERARQQGFLYVYSLSRLVAFIRPKISIDELLNEMVSGPSVQVLQVLVPTMERHQRLELLKRLMKRPAYEDPKWLAVVNVCIALSGSICTGKKLPLKIEKSKKSEVDEKSESLSESSLKVVHCEAPAATKDEVFAPGQVQPENLDVEHDSDGSKCVNNEAELVIAEVSSVLTLESSGKTTNFDEPYCGNEELEPLMFVPLHEPISNPIGEKPAKDCIPVNVDEAYAEIVREIMEGLLLYKAENKDMFSLVLELPFSWGTIVHNVQLINLLTSLVTDQWRHLEATHWDFVLCSLGSLIKSCQENCLCPKLQYSAFANAIYRLVAATATTINCYSEVPTSLKTEWTEFFACRIYVPVMDLFNLCAASITDSTPEVIAASMIESLVAAIRWIPTNVVVNNNLPLLLDARWGEIDNYLPVKVSTVLNHFVPMLIHPCRDVQDGVYVVLRSLVPALPTFAPKDLPLDDACPTLVPGALELAILKRHDVDAMLRDKEFGETCEPSNPALVRGCLYVGSLIMQLYSCSSPEVRFSQLIFLKDGLHIESLLSILFRLLPANPTLVTSPLKKDTPNKIVPISIFSSLLAADSFDTMAMTLDLQQLSCFMYLEILRRFPVIVREWWNRLERRQASFVEKFTAKYVSPLLCYEDICAVQNEQRKFDNMSIRTRLTTREVIASYDVEEIKFELVIKLAENHPLGPVEILTERRVGVSSQQWRVWMMQLTTFVTYQNGSILDGLVLWKGSIDKKFAGIEECYVCYYMLHISTLQLPRKICRTCKKKFHSSCLYKWFNTSGHSTCPLCRSIW